MLERYNPHRSNTVNNDISDFYPAFEWQNFKQSQHGISYVVKIKISGIGPEKKKKKKSGWRL